MATPREASRTTRPVHVRATPSTVLAVAAAVLGVRVVVNIVDAARRPIGWFIFATVVALLLAPAVAVLERRVRRGAAIAVVLVASAGAVGGVVYGLVNDLSAEVARLEEAVPDAARQLEEDDRFGEAAREFRLAARAEDAVAGLRDRLTGAATDSARDAGVYLTIAVLTLFMLSGVNRMITGALGLVRDVDRRVEIARVLDESLAMWRRYVTVAVAQSAVVGLMVYGMSRALDLPAPVPLALVAAAAALLPDVGIALGALPAALLAAGLEAPAAGGIVLGGAILVQVGQIRLQREINQRILHVGPATVLLVGLLAFGVVGLAGAFVALALAVLGLAVIEAIGDRKIHETIETVVFDEEPPAEPADAPADVS